MKKVEVFKDSKGGLFESEKDYILSEAKIKRKQILDTWERLTMAIESKPEYYFSFIKEIGNSIIDNNNTKEDLQKQFDKINELFIKEKEIKLGSYSDLGDTNIEQEPYLWGNDILPGHDVNR
jgi:hypothetical protein